MLYRIGKLVSIPTLWRSLQFCGITRKKIQKAAKERSKALHRFYLYNIGMHYTSEQLIFIDKTAKDKRTLTRYCDKERFQTFILTQLLPQMNPYSVKHNVLVMDNACIHHNDDLVTTIEDINGRILYLPSYLPDFNPIETAFSALKSWLKRYRDLVDYFDLIYLILIALAQTTSEIAKKYFAESIYDV
ncbi:unnamed protein product [Rhizophagus irregularis]|nr:unnamed protein product [Rhizophagus irregularis]